MIRYENQCCDCNAALYPCIGEMCSRRHVKIYECDNCSEEVEAEELYNFDGEQLCIDCIRERLEVVE